MGYEIEFDASPAYELLSSLNLFLFNKGINGMKNLFTKRMNGPFRKAVTPHLAGAKQGLAAEALAILIWQCPDKTDTASFIDWFAALDVDELHERLHPHVKNLSRLIPSVAEWQPKAIHWMQVWHHHYFSELESNWTKRATEDLSLKQADLAQTPNQTDFVESVLQGVYVEVVPKLSRVLLIPGVHYAPANLRMDFRDTLLFVYPMSTSVTESGTRVMADLSRMTKALSDEVRLLILSNLSVTPVRFTDIATQTGLPKSTLHNHLIHLRDAGFVRVHAHLNKTDRYSLRHQAFSELTETLNRFQAQLRSE
ncbi:hypothetical protein AAC03nite_30070 [Alicyclobacillus acidoterrestris]|uniref:ArsR/SmtB family transcription factor n=1 Tax=Alicyclobacillus suci TaxID=2816080 RepID=UPI00118F6212|nr:winged helix-turn-helix domain-containing protein [Alicyclobacillus suci]GEO27222.1 hypothetical protein AAC03nite_30070 [Alicyclobacillus acidoterrestris]